MADGAFKKKTSVQPDPECSLAPCGTLQLCVWGGTDTRGSAPWERLCTEDPHQLGNSACSPVGAQGLEAQVEAVGRGRGDAPSPALALRRPGQGRGRPAAVCCGRGGGPRTRPPRGKGSRCRWGLPWDHTWLEQSLWAAAAGVSGYGSSEMKAAAAASVGCKEIGAQQIRRQPWTRRRRGTEHLCPAPPCPSNEDSGRHGGSSAELSWAL